MRPRLPKGTTPEERKRVYAERDRERYARNRDAQRLRNRAYYEAHRDPAKARKTMAPRLPAWVTPSDRSRIYWRRAKEALGRKPPLGQVCEVCSCVPVVWDHDHRTGLRRGWLCRACNIAEGLLKSDPVLIRALADYVAK